MIQTVIINKEVINNDGNERAFYNKILDEVPVQFIERFAEVHLDMIYEKDCDCEDTDIEDFHDQDFEAEANRRGWIVFKTMSISQQMEVEKLKENLGL
jgi:hypothetical protein